MAKFAKTKPLAPAKKPYSMGPVVPTITHQGGQGYLAGDPHFALFNAAVSGMLADQFYESGDERLATLVSLVPQCDPAWLVNFAGWLREDANLRSAPVVIAAEYVRAKFPDARKVVASVLKRPDEPGELLAYWRANYGRAVPMPIKRGIADAITSSLYHEVSLLRYDGQDRPWRFGDVIEVVHPTPKDDYQSDLFKYALDRRRHKDAPVPERLRKVAKTLALENLPQDQRRAALPQLTDRDVIFSWERLAGWLPGGMDAEAWTAVAPTMGYMAVLRNLNNFDKANIDRKAKDAIAAKLADPDAVKGSRVLPFRFQTAYKNITSDFWKQPLQDAADLAMQNLPRFSGRTLIMVDVSGSMNTPVGAGKSRNPLRCSELAGFFAETLARRCDDALIAPYDTTVHSTKPPSKANVLLAASDPKYRPQGGTNTWSCTEQVYTQHGPFDRVFIITDEQTSDRESGKIKCPVITWNLAGYRPHQAAHGVKNRYYVGGYSDTTLQTLPAMLAHGATGKWPWE